MRQWRLIYDYPTSGAQNMAMDEAILSIGIPTLRFYEWSPGCLSLGYGQKIADVDFERTAAAGWDIVRRPTGGRAILHIDELTYSLALPGDDPIAAGDIIESYRQISEALMAGLHHLGARPAADRLTKRDAAHSPACFEMPSHYEMTFNGRKLIGSAQMRRKEGVLQHGSLPLYGDIGRICDALTYPYEASRAQARAQVQTRAATLQDALNSEIVAWEVAAEAMVKGFREIFNVDFARAELSDAERYLAAQLVREKYANPDWTTRR
jgi:lipoyl(octanoyl) transferase